MTDLYTKIKEVTELQGLPGFEGQIRDYLRNRMTPYIDRCETD
ncbi:glutamyl aminopeptidase, partial [Streptococcus pyogenes]